MHAFLHMDRQVMHILIDGWKEKLLQKLWFLLVGSGKSYTMMGSSGQKGLIPRLCDMLFDRIQKVLTCLYFSGVVPHGMH